MFYSTTFDHGMIYTDFLNGGREDYTTVCCLIIPFIDAALVLAEDHPSYAEKYRRAAGEIADYLYHRKEFHTEAYVSEETEPEMEDGSISCTALSLLYYAAKIERREEFIARGKGDTRLTRAVGDAYADFALFSFLAALVGNVLGGRCHGTVHLLRPCLDDLAG